MKASGATGVLMRPSLTKSSCIDTKRWRVRPLRLSARIWLDGHRKVSLDHFAQLLTVYRGAADGADAAAIDSVRADVDAAREELRTRVGDGAEAALAEAHELYRVRELAEVPMYAHAA